MQIEQKIELVKAWGFKEITEGVFQRNETAYSSCPTESINEFWMTGSADYIDIYVDKKWTDNFKIDWDLFIKD